MPEHPRVRLLVAYLALAAVLGLVAAPVYLAAGPQSRPGVVRVAVALFAALVLLHVIRAARARLEDQPSSAFDAALAPAPSEPRLDPLFVRCCAEIRFGSASAQYFDQVLWPRLARLAARRTGDRVKGWLVKPSGRGFLRRGPSLDTLRAAIAEIERLP